MPQYADGRIGVIPCYKRNGRILPSFGMYKAVITALQLDSRLEGFLKALEHIFRGNPGFRSVDEGVGQALEAFEAMIRGGWVSCKHQKNKPLLQFGVDKETSTIHRTRDFEAPVSREAS